MIIDFEVECYENGTKSEEAEGGKIAEFANALFAFAFDIAAASSAACFLKATTTDRVTSAENFKLL